ncbi:MAG: guanylate cyclase [Comamonadaceae bacterium]|nr:MAG: guanylate cyclase [Comamonadaceae bacterium]
MSATISEFQSFLEASGVDAALQALNSGVRHRYTAIFRLDEKTLVNLYLFDKHGEVTPPALERVPLADSFCQLVLRDGLFKSENSTNDRRLDFSPYQTAVMSYHGVPIENNHGELYGTLCHFDLVEQSISDADFTVLQKAASLLPPYLR